jgi:N-6 DNA methylase
MTKAKGKWEYGDFQTPPDLASAAVAVLGRMNVKPKSILEPTCGKGSFLRAAIRLFPEAARFVGVEIREEYLDTLRNEIDLLEVANRVELIRGDFFVLDWELILESLPAPVLIVGNPPWVTSAELGAIGSRNVPKKSNFQGRKGYDAITGKSNFDISEWMLLQHLDWLKKRRGTIAVLCKTAVARKVLLHGWKHGAGISEAKIFIVNAKKYFDASVDACLLVMNVHANGESNDCSIYQDLSAEHPMCTIGYHDGFVLSDVERYRKLRQLNVQEFAHVWRSGIKHDRSKIMELDREGGKYRNGFSQLVDLEERYVYPMLKSSDIGNEEIRYGRKWMLVTQEYVGEDTSLLAKNAPKVWKYLESNSRALDGRLSLIYRKQPRYAVFGVGQYSFSPWKVAISGFYKRLAFKVIQPFEGKPVVLDDTSYFLACWSRAEAEFLCGLLNSHAAQGFLQSMIFWSDKRPITIEILKRLSLHALSTQLGCEAEYLRFVRKHRDAQAKEAGGELCLVSQQAKGKNLDGAKPVHARSVTVSRGRVVRG